jgi:acyl-CoA dehydrogenase
LVGSEGEGWTIARYLLEFERGGFVMNGLLARKLERCRALLSPAAAAASASEAGAMQTGLAQLEVDLLALAAAELRVALSFEIGSSPGPEAMVLKVEFTELMQRIESFGVALLGQRALGFAGHDSAVAMNADAGRDAIAQALLGSYLNNRAATIYGGSSEIQRDIVARTVLGR